MHPKFTQALDCYLAMLADLEDPRNAMKVRGASIEREWQAGAGVSIAPPEAMREQCTDVPRAQLFEAALIAIGPHHKAIVMRHFDGPHSQYTRPWQQAATDDAKHWGLSAALYVCTLQQGISMIEAVL